MEVLASETTFDLDFGKGGGAFVRDGFDKLFPFIRSSSASLPAEEVVGASRLTEIVESRDLVSCLGKRALAATRHARTFF